MKQKIICIILVSFFILNIGAGITSIGKSEKINNMKKVSLNDVRLEPNQRNEEKLTQIEQEQDDETTDLGTIEVYVSYFDWEVGENIAVHGARLTVRNDIGVVVRTGKTIIGSKYFFGLPLKTYDVTLNDYRFKKITKEVTLTLEDPDGYVKFYDLEPRTKTVQLFQNLQFLSRFPLLQQLLKL